jgi:phosphohistidine swiveling domain-containing protein
MEDAKHESLREVAFLRRLMLEIGARFGLGDTVWQLSLDEVATLERVGGVARVRAMLAERQARMVAFADAPPLPAGLTRRLIERGPLGVREAAAQAAGAAQSGIVRSTRVSGHAAVEGRAIKVAREVCDSGAPIPGFEPGDIIVARSMHPAWLPQMIRSGGVVVETGGWLSHMAILARERGLAMSVNARGIDRIETGMRLRLEPDGAVVCL